MPWATIRLSLQPLNMRVAASGATWPSHKFCHRCAGELAPLVLALVWHKMELHCRRLYSSACRLPTNSAWGLPSQNHLSLLTGASPGSVHLFLCLLQGRPL